MLIQDRNEKTKLGSDNLEENELGLNNFEKNELGLDANEVGLDDLEVNEVELDDLKANKVGLDDFETNDLEANEVKLDDLEASEVGLDNLEVNEVKLDFLEMNKVDNWIILEVLQYRQEYISKANFMSENSAIGDVFDGNWYKSLVASFYLQTLMICSNCIHGDINCLKRSKDHLLLNANLPLIQRVKKEDLMTSAVIPGPKLSKNFNTSCNYS
ncbi:45844_t:CDS:2 [Gigaspora margarita]|uniref:45844_t:CDS:1 n=1 Tax=Gigaspora margarita TaxID=4874 RepID=A0ABN7UX00_GIGMA|nr:45844_t:CDS:2 [Gigaspora margarita]